jgi:NAD(P) transhydrogenase
MREDYDFDLLCIGSGLAGQRAAVQAAKLGKRAAVVERGHVIGGVCVDTGTIPSKTFREAVLSLNARAFSDSRQMRSRSFVRPTAQELLARVEDVEHQQADIIKDQLQRNEVTVLVGEASFKDSHTVVIASDQGSAMVTAANFLIAV